MTYGVALLVIALAIIAAVIYLDFYKVAPHIANGG